MPSGVQDDTEMACSRTHNAGAWTQLVYQSETWRDLAARADQREAAAWHEIAELMAANLEQVANSQCTSEMVANVRASAARLAGNK